MTERQTNASRGKVVSMLRPKQLDGEVSYILKTAISIVTHSRAMFTMILLEGKLLSTLPWVFDPNDKKPARAITKHITIETPVE
jgi:hypothetical protein